MKPLKQIKPEDFTRQKSDVNGNPRYAIHFFSLLTDTERNSPTDLSIKYDIAVKRANKIGGRKYHCKAYGGGIIFQSYNLNETIKHIQRIVNTEGIF